jgi:hypothetical protein
MCSRQLFSALVICAIFAQSTQAGDLGEFQRHLTNLESSLRQEKSFEKRYEKFLSSRAALRAAKKSKPRSEESGEIAMTLVLDSFAEFPDTKITLADCRKRQKESEQMNRTHDKENVDPFFQRAKEILKTLCP